MNSYKDNFCNYNSTYLLLILIRFVELHCGSYTSYCTPKLIIQEREFHRRAIGTNLIGLHLDPSYLGLLN